MSEPTPHWSFETARSTSDRSPTPRRARVPCRSTRRRPTSSRTPTTPRILFALKEFGNIYTRIMNPTQDAVEQRIASLEGGVGALLVASGQAAEALAILNIAEAGDHIVTSPSLYGGTFNLLKHTLPKFGLEVSFVSDPNDIESSKSAVRPNTKLFFAETISNPKSEVLDIEAVARVAHDNGGPPRRGQHDRHALPDPPTRVGRGRRRAFRDEISWGTWHLDRRCHRGRRDVRLRQGPREVPPTTTPQRETYHGLVFARDLGVGSPLGANLAFILKARVQLLRDLGQRSRPSTRSSSPRASRP